MRTTTPIFDITISVPTRVVMGRGALGRLGELTAQHGEHALVVCGRTAMRATGALDRTVTSLRAANVAVSVFDRVSPNPRSDEADDAVALLRARRCDVVVGIGGGSALDLAKAVAVGADHESVGELVGRTLEPSPASLPIVAVPTTAGSGSEVTKGAIITDVRRRFKAGIRGQDLFPKVALVDPALTETLPGHVALETGFDTLAHAIEAYLARKANPFTDTLAERIIRLAGPGLRDLATGKADDEVRDSMCLAAVLGGLCVATVSTCLPHRMQQAMVSGISHGRGLAILYPAWLRRAEPWAGDRFDRLGELLGGSNVPEAVERIIALLGGPLSLSEAGFGRDDLDSFVAKVSGNLDNDPIDGIDEHLLRQLYQEAY